MPPWQRLFWSMRQNAREAYEKRVSKCLFNIEETAKNNGGPRDGRKGTEVERGNYGKENWIYRTGKHGYCDHGRTSGKKDGEA